MGWKKLVVAITFSMLENLINTFKLGAWQQTYSLKNKLMVTRWRDRLGVWD